MQNPIAAFTIPTCVADTVGPKPLVEPSEVAFVVTFAEAALAVEPDSRVDDAKGADFLTQDPWPLVGPPNPMVLPTMDTAIHVAENVPVDPAEGAGSLYCLHPDGSGEPASNKNPLFGHQALSVSRSYNLASGSYSLSIVGLGVWEDAVSSSDPLISRLDLPFSGTHVNSGSIDQVGSDDDQAPSTESDTGALYLWRGADEREVFDLSGATADENTWQYNALRTQVNHVETYLSKAFGPEMGFNASPLETADQYEEMKVKPDQPTVRLEFDQVRIAFSEGGRLPIRQMEWPDGPDLAASVAGGNQESPGEEPCSDFAVGAISVSPYVQASSPPHDSDPNPSPVPISILERSFPDRIVSEQVEMLPTVSAMVASDKSSTLVSEVIPVVLESVGVRASNASATEIAPTVGNILRSGQPDKCTTGTSATPPMQSSNALDQALVGLVLSEWDEDPLEADQQVNTLQTLVSTYSNRSASGTLASALSLSTLPVPQVASYIAGALIRSADGVTELSLSPEELGHVRLRMKPDAENPDRLLVFISVERPETLGLFRRHADELAEAIRIAGYSSADIGYGQNDRGNQPEHGKKSVYGDAELPREGEAHFGPGRPLMVSASLDMRL